MATSTTNASATNSNPAKNKMAGILERTGLFSEEQVVELLALHRSSEESLTQVVVDQGYADEEKFLNALGEAMNLPCVTLDEDIESSVLEELPTKAVFQYGIVPLQVENGVLRVVTDDPFKPGMMEALRMASGKRVRFALCRAKDLEKAVTKFYGVGGETIERMIEEDRIDLEPEEDLFGKSDLDDLDEEASVVKFVNQIIWEANQ